MKIILGRFKRYLAQKGYKDSSIYKREKTAQAFISYLKSINTPLSSITVSIAETYIKSLREKKLKKQTVSKCISMLKLFNKFLIEKEGIIKENIFADCSAASGEEKIINEKYESEYVKDYIKTMRAKGSADGTITEARRILNRFFKYMEDNNIKKVYEVKKDDIEEYFDYVYSSYNYSASYRCVIIHFIKDFFKIALNMGVIGYDPAKKILAPRKERILPRDVPSDREIKQIILSIPEQDIRSRLIFEVLYGSGLRKSEAKALKLDDIDYEKRSFNVTDAKTKSSRIVPFNDITYYVLKEYIGIERIKYTKSFSKKNIFYDPDCPEHEGQAYLFLSRKGKALSLNMFTGIVQKYVRKSGVNKHITPHSLRHACAVEMLKHGAGIRWIQKMLGHEDINTTMIYTRLGVSDLKDIIDKMHPHGIKKVNNHV